MKRLFPAIVTGMCLGLLLASRLELGLVRYFDADEFAYLHWAHNVFSGEVPYRDFLLYVPPGFLWVLAPFYGFFHGVDILVAGRVFAWIVFVGICIALGALMVILRGNKRDKENMGKNIWLFLLPGVVLSFLPMPADKFLEVRPDNLAVLVSLIGLIGHIWKKPFFAGVAYGISLLILPKTLPLVAVAFLTFPSVALITGLAMPFLLFGIWILVIGDFNVAWYSLTKLPFEVNRLGEVFGMQPDLFFYPNDVYYGSRGWNVGLIANHIVWFAGLMIGVYRLFTREFLIAGSMFAYILVFMYGYELRHAQYLIPIAVFVAFYAADGIRKLGVFGALGVIGVMMPIFFMVNQSKFAYSNAGDIETLRRILLTIPSDAYVFDLVGATIFYRDPYYVSGVPFGQWKPYLTRPLPDLKLQSDHYIYRDQLGRADGVVPFAPTMYHYVQ